MEHHRHQARPSRMRRVGHPGEAVSNVSLHGESNAEDLNVFDQALVEASVVRGSNNALRSLYSSAEFGSRTFEPEGRRRGSSLSSSKHGSIHGSNSMGSLNRIASNNSLRGLYSSADHGSRSRLDVLHHQSVHESAHAESFSPRRRESLSDSFNGYSILSTTFQETKPDDDVELQPLPFNKPGNLVSHSSVSEAHIRGNAEFVIGATGT